MRITPVEEHGIDLLSSDLVRSPGLHMSELYGSLYKELEPKRYGGDTPPDPMLLAMGTAWEAHLEYLLKKSQPNANGETFSRPPEFMDDNGIAFSPDLLIDNGVRRIGEIKLTWQSSREPIDAPKFSKWWTQLMAYCHGLETPYGRLYATFVNGNYGEHRWPQLKIWDVTFSSRELHDNYRMLVNHGIRRELGHLAKKP